MIGECRFAFNSETVPLDVVARITRRLMLSGGFQSQDPDFDDAA